MCGHFGTGLRGTWPRSALDSLSLSRSLCCVFVERAPPPPPVFLRTFPSSTAAARHFNRYTQHTPSEREKEPTLEGSSFNPTVNTPHLQSSRCRASAPTSTPLYFFEFSSTRSRRRRPHSRLPVYILDHNSSPNTQGSRVTPQRILQTHPSFFWSSPASSPFFRTPPKIFTTFLRLSVVVFPVWPFSPGQDFIRGDAALGTGQSPWEHTQTQRRRRERPTDRPTSHGSLLPVPTGVRLGICRWCVLRLAAGSTHTSEHVSSPTWPQQNCTRFVCDKNSLLFKCLMFIRDSRGFFPES